MAYLPQQKSADEIRAIVREALASLPADGRNQGAVMKVVMPQLKGVADGNLVRQIVTGRTRLAPSREPRRSNLFVLRG